MNRIANIFVLVCIAVVSASSVAILRYQFELGWDSAALAGIVLLFVLALVHWRATRRRESRSVAGDLAILSEKIDRLAGDMQNVDRRLAAIESASPRRERGEIEAVVAEVEVIGALMKQVVETIADLEIRVNERPATAEPPRPAAAAAGSAAAKAPPARPAAPGAEASLVPRRFAHLGEAGFLDLTRRSIEANRIDIHLQPIVTLPQRKIRFYESLTRLRAEDGETIFPSDYAPLAEQAGIMPALDNQILLRTVQILRRLSARSKDVGMFCNISVASLSEGAFFAEFLGFLDANRNLADTLVFVFAQRAVKGMGPIEHEALRAMNEVGFRFAIDQVLDLKSGLQMLGDRGFRFAKIPADRLLSRPEELGSDIHPADLSSLFARYGMDLIIDSVESEAQVVDLLDFGIRFAQGNVFSPPRPVRQDVINAAPPEAVRAAPEPRRNVIAKAIAGRQ
jgi:cyclic-di-GMP phosphodiesterase TipF (flagellum assembly factor)